METLVSESDYKSDYYHNTQEHGPMWTLLNQMLHVIVLVYTVFGMIRFKVIFIRMVGLVRWCSLLIVGLNWYISIKFALLALMFYLFNMELDSRRVPLLAFNCSLDEYADWMRDTGAYSRSAALLAKSLHLTGGPYRLLGNRATLMYGFFAIAIYIMLALFPVEHYYFDIGFNYIRFVLNDAGCLRDCYAKKQRHVDRLNNWSRNMNSSMITLSMKRAINQRDLRSSYVYENLLNTTTVAAAAALAFSRKSPPSPISILEPASLADNDDDRPSRREEERLNAPLKSLRRTLATNHSNEPSYSVKLANENLKKFKPYVRSEDWFKISMVIYPIFIFYYFSSLTCIIGAIVVFFTGTLGSINDTCQEGLKSRGLLAEAARVDLPSNLSWWDRLTLIEGNYSVFAMSCASSFYCSYYFGTILELYIWIEEISQQLNLSRVIIEFVEVRPPPVSWISAPPLETSASSSRSPSQDGQVQVQEINPMLESLFPYHDDSLGDGSGAHLIRKNFNHFGGLNSIWAHCKFRWSPQSERLRKYELMAIRLASKKQTILRASYINLNMFFDELNDTRFMATIILRRTTQIAFGFALMVSITRSQFETNIIYLSVLLFSCLAILNLYLICAAFINSSINRLLPQIHALISVSIMAGTDYDLLEFWLRHIQAYGLDKDAMSYKIYGYKVTWSTILNFNGAVSSVYLFTVY